MKYYFSLVILLLTVHTNASCQDKVTDSLSRVTKTGKPAEKVKAWNALANAVVYDNPDQAKQYARQAIQLALHENDRAGLSDAYTRIGIAFDVSGLYDSSIYYYERSLAICNQIDNLKGRGSALNNLGLIYWNLGDYDKALAHFFDALKDFESIGNDQYTANALNNIGLVYDDINKHDEAIIFHHKARAYYEKLNDHYLRGAVYNNLGNSYFSLNRFDSAEYYYLRSIGMQQEANDDYGLSIAYSGYATLLDTLGKTALALEYDKKSLALKNKLNEVSGQAILLINMAGIYRKLHAPAEELDCLNRAKEIAEKNNLKKELMNAYLKLSGFYEKSDVGLSLNYFKKYNAYKDSVFNETSNRQITELSTKYETGKKELKLKEKDLLIARKNMMLLIIAASLLLLIILGFFLYKRNQFRQEQKLQREILKQQELATRAILSAEENERRRIAAELHDGIGQMMSAARMNLSVFEQELPFNGEAQKKSFDNVVNLVDMSCREIRSVSHQMMPNALLKKGLADAIREFTDRIDRRILVVDLHTEGLENRLEPNTESVMYRVVQECVNNVIKHAGATHLDISLIQDQDGLSVTIEDNGKGFDHQEEGEKDGIGITNIRSRVQFLKGTVEFDSAPGRGTLVAIHVPHQA